MSLTNVDPHRRSNRQHGFPATRPSSSVFQSRPCTSLEVGMFLLLARKAELELRRDDDKCNSFRSTKTVTGFSVFRKDIVIRHECSWRGNPKLEVD